MPKPVEYAALLPDPAPERLPLVYFLHGGNGSRDFLGDTRGLFDRAWADGTLRPCVVVTVSAGRSFYMDYRDGSERWETLLAGPFLDHVRQRFGTSTGRRDTAVVGISMGGMGGLRLAFKHPDVFGTAVALEPGIEPVLAFRDIEWQDRFWRDDSLFHQIYGSPVDEAYWAENHPATIASRRPKSLAEVAIYLECGDQDSFGLHRGTEFLHRVLFDAGISHEYRLVKGADHLGRTLPGRFADAIKFLAGSLDPLPPDDSLEPFHTVIGALRSGAGL
jgi:S-formylglutathione hydrolase